MEGEVVGRGCIRYGERERYKVETLTVVQGAMQNGGATRMNKGSDLWVPCDRK